MQDRAIDQPRAKHWKRGLRGAGYTLAGGLGGALGGGALGAGLGYGGGQLAKALGANLSDKDIKGIAGVGGIAGGVLGSAAGGGYGAYKGLPEEVRERAKQGMFYEQGVKCACEQLGIKTALLSQIARSGAMRGLAGGAMSGGGIGAITGAISAGEGNRLSGAARGAVTGGLLGGAGGAVAGGLRTRGLAQKLNPEASKIAPELLRGQTVMANPRTAANVSKHLNPAATSIDRWGTGIGALSGVGGGYAAG